MFGSLSGRSQREFSNWSLTSYPLIRSSEEEKGQPRRREPYVDVPRFTSDLGLPGTVGTKAAGILKQMIDGGMGSGKGPAGIAAAAIYTACALDDVRRTQKEISEVTGVTEVTVRNRYKDIAEYLDLDVDT